MIFIYPFVLILMGLFLFALNKKSVGAQNQIINLGMIFGSIVLIYGLIPSVGLLFYFNGVGQIMDSRFSSGFDATEVEKIQWMHLLFMTGFMVGYFSGPKKKVTTFSSTFQIDAQALVNPLVAIAIVAYVLPILMLQVWGGSVSSDYISSYTRMRGAPMLVQQVYNIVNQLQLSSLIAAVTVLIAAKPQRHFIVGLALGFNMLLESFGGGSRTVAFIAFMSYVVVCSIFVPGFNWRKGFMYLIPALFLFMLAGLIRDELQAGNLLDFFQTGEFITLFINTLDLKARLDIGWGEEFRYNFYLVDLIRLIPSQLFDGAKLDPARWYAEMFYLEYYEAGGGFAFGTLSESVAGFGAPEAAVRGLLLGFIFRFCNNKLMGKKVSVGHIFAYVWMISICYYSYRDTTFTLAVRALYQVVPILLVISILKRRSRRKSFYKMREK